MTVIAQIRKAETAGFHEKRRIELGLTLATEEWSKRMTGTPLDYQEMPTLDVFRTGWLGHEDLLLLAGLGGLANPYDGEIGFDGFENALGFRRPNTGNKPDLRIIIMLGVIIPAFAIRGNRVKKLLLNRSLSPSRLTLGRTFFLRIFIGHVTHLTTRENQKEGERWQVVRLPRLQSGAPLMRRRL